MEKYLIKGGRPLEGEIKIGGAKNSAVAILPATMLARGIFTIENIPVIKDIDSLIAILSEQGAVIKKLSGGSVLIIDTRNIKSTPVSYGLAKKLRASYYMFGSLLGMYGYANVALPGGCDFGRGGRPMDMHFDAFTSLGAKCTMKGDTAIIEMESGRPIGADIYMNKVSVGATINTLLTAVLAQGITTIENAAREPHVVDVANFLNHMGANIQGAGTNKIRIIGVKELHACEYSIVPDQIEAGTYMVAAAATGGNVLLTDVEPKHLELISANLRRCGVTVIEGEESVRVIGSKTLRSCNISTQPYPGFPTDMQPQFTTLLALSSGKSVITDTIYESRFRYVEQLNRMGADISTNGNQAIVEGVSSLYGATVRADDLRAGAAMIIAGLCAEGVTTIENIVHIDRGYEKVIEKLSGANADITRIEE